MGNIGARMAIGRSFEWIFSFTIRHPESHVTALGGKWVGLNELLADSDFVTIIARSIVKPAA
jgi:phosphoglycerate dehydrogenase-like enzyme